MNRLSRYLFTQLLVATLFSCFAVTMVVWFSQSIRLLSMVINSGGSVWAFFKLMLLVLPTFMPLVLPLSLVVACLFVFHRLTNESELQVMQAVGTSPYMLARPALLLGVAVSAIAYMMAIWVAPAANQELVKLKYEIRNDFSLLLLRTGNFHDLADGLTFYARERGKEGDLRGLLIHDTRRAGKPSTIMAESGELIRTEKGPNVLVKNGVRQELDSATGLLSQLSFKSYLVDLTSVNNTLVTREPEARERGMAELLNPELYAKNQVALGRFMSELHLRLAMPFLAITFALIACVAMLTGHYNRRGMAQKIIIATLAVVAIEAGVLSLLNLIAKHEFLIPALYALTFGPFPFLLARLKKA